MWRIGWGHPLRLVAGNAADIRSDVLPEARASEPPGWQRSRGATVAGSYVRRVANSETCEHLSQSERALNVSPFLVLGGRRPDHPATGLRSQPRALPPAIMRPLAS